MVLWLFVFRPLWVNREQGSPQKFSRGIISRLPEQQQDNLHPTEGLFFL